MIHDLTNIGSQPDNLQPDNLSLSRREIFFAIPKADEETFARLPDKVRAQTLTLLTLLQRIHESGSKSAEAQAIAYERAGQRGFSDESLLRKYYRYLRTHDWKDILDRAQAGPAHWHTDAAAGLPPAFVEFWKSLCERNQRKNAPARRELIRIWQTGRGLCPVTGQPKTYSKFPGYPDWAPSLPIPQGWSLANLNRHAPKPFELAVARQGREPAAIHRRRVFSTRAGLATGQFYLFDDLEFDKKVNFPGNRMATRPLGLLGLDLFSACIISNLYKPTIIDEAGAKKKLREREMLWLIVDTLCHQGYRADVRGTSLVVEHGTAAIRPDFEERIFAATAGKVTVDRSGLSSAHMPGLFEGGSHGNPRFKASLESVINLIHNEGASLPGATGKDRDHAPTQLAGVDRYNNNMLKLARLLPPHRAALLQYPVLNFYDFCELTQDIIARINRRVDHQLEGWEKSKNFVQEFYVDLGEEGHWLSETQWFALPPEKQTRLRPLVSGRQRQLSPWEVWTRDATQLQKLGECLLPALLGPDLAEERSVRGGYITVENQELDSEPFRFPAYPHNTGDKFLVYHNPFHPDRLILTNHKGAYVGTLERQIVPCRADRDQVLRQLGEARREESQRLAGVVTRALPVAEANRDLHRNNLKVANGQPVTAAELQSARDLRAHFKTHGKAAIADALRNEVGPVTPCGPLPDQSEISKSKSEISEEPPVSKLSELLKPL
jgi:hypothetical protein